MNAPRLRYLACLLVLSSVLPVGADTVSITPTRDTTIFQEEVDNSDGGGAALYAGANGSVFARRALLYFDIAGNVPSGATITSVTLTLTLAQVAGSGQGMGAGTPHVIRLFALTQTWGEGTEGLGLPIMMSGGGFPADPGDATWDASAYSMTSPTLWHNPGGDFVSTESTDLSVSGTTVGATYTWPSTTQFVADAQNWLANPSANFGWIMKNDDEDVARSFYAFYSKDWAGPPTAPPVLTVTYTPATSPTWRDTWLQQYYSPVSSYPGDTANPTGDGLNNLLDYAYGLSPLVAHPPGTGLQGTLTASGGGNNTYTFTFPRDPRAVDLTYQMQTSNDLINWTTVVQSVAGGVPTGSAYASEADEPGAAPVQIVTAVETLPAPATHFARLVVTRSD